MRPNSRLLSMAGLAVGALLVTAACSSAAATPSSSVEGATSGTGGIALSESTTSLGTFLTGKDGMTLYVFAKDSADKSACTGTCATYWPPLTVTSGASVTGPADATAGFGTITRADGTIQVTYNHMPLYYYSGDNKAGDTSGQGVQGIWFVAPVSGAMPAMSPAATATPAASASMAAAGMTLGESSSAVGKFLTGKDGMTLYVLTKDGADMSTCSGTCATYWPALTVTSGTSVAGPADATAVFGTIARADGTTQVTYNHMPLYYYSGDKAAGDTTGQGVQGVWFVAPVSGARPAAVSAATPTAAATKPGGGGYTGY